MHGEIGHDEAVHGKADHRFLREAEAGVAVKDLCRRHGFSGADFDSGHQAPDNSANKTFPNNTLSFKCSVVPRH